MGLMISRVSRQASLGAAALGLLLAAMPVLAGPPFITDDPEPVDYRHFETYLAYETVKTQGGSVSAPLFELNYGAMPDVQVSVTLPYVFNSVPGQVTQKGMGDVVLGVKYRVLQETADQPMISVYPIYIPPTGNAAKGLGNGGAQLFLPVWLQKRWGNWLGYGGGGYWINRAPGAGRHWYFGWTLMNDVTERLAVGGEVFHATDQRPVDNASTGFNVGAIYKLDGNNRVLFSAGRGLSELRAQNTTTGYVAYSLSW